MKRTQKRYSKPYEIRAEILKLRRKAKQFRDAGYELEALSKEEFQKYEEADPSDKSAMLSRMAGLEHHRKAIRKQKYATTIEEVKIPRLVKALAELNTTPMPFLADESVTA